MKTPSKYLYIIAGFLAGFVLYLAGMTHEGLMHNISIRNSFGSLNHFITPLFSGMLVGLLGFFYWRQKNLKIQAHQLLIESETIYKTVFQTSPNSININTLDGIYVDINDGFTSLTQYTKPEVIGLSSEEIKIWAIPGDREKLVDGLKNNGSVENLETLFRCKDGTFRTGLISARIIDLKGKPHIISVTRDISVRKKIENELDEQNRLLNAIYQAATNVSFITITLEGNNSLITSFSPGAENIFGYKAEEIIGKPVAMLHNKDDVNEFHEIQQFFTNNRKGISSEKILIRKSGEPFHALLIVYPIFDHDDLPYASLGISIDITDLKNTQKELEFSKEKAEESDRLKTAFLNNMSHEVRTPLNAIVGFTNLLTKPNQSAEKIKKFSEIIKEKSDKLVEIISDVIEISQIQAKLITIKNSEFDFLQLVNNTISAFDSQIKQKELQLNIYYNSSDKVHFISSDKPKIAKIFQHILDNSVKFTSKGNIRIDFNLQPNGIGFSISDTGIGISKDMQQIIFDPFRQIETGLTRDFGGTGLGLSIIKAYTELLGGNINLQSEPNIGTTTSVYIPAVQIFRNELLVDKIMKSPFKSKRILIVEDELSNFEFVKELLLETNANIIHALNGKQAIEICRNERQIDFILMDIKMPIMDGITATKLIKAFRPEVPIIAQTAFALESDKEKFLESGFDDYICKPLNEKELFGILEKYSFR